MSKEERIVDYYVLCNSLKNVIRSGWINWKVKRERLESIAEHVYGVQMLAIAMKSEYDYDIDIMKVVFMLAIHELGETIIGDITPFEMDQDEKERIEHAAVHDILSTLIDGKQIEELFLEFDAKETKEARFAYWCDKLECDFQCKLYDQEGCVSLEDQENNPSFKDKRVSELLESEKTWSGMWLEYGQEKNTYDQNFMAVSQYLQDHNISESFTKKLKK